MRKPILTALLLLAAACNRVPVELPQIFSDDMLLQRDRPVPVWGSASPGSAVTISWQGGRIRTRAGEDGRWSAVLPATQAGGPYELRINGTVFRNVLVGDVFLCSGQSNMELPVSRCLDAVRSDVTNYSNSAIRYLGVPMAYDFDGPREDLPGCAWQVLDSDSTAMGWGAVSYFTARYLQERTSVPIGMVNASVGGSPVEAWLPEGLLPAYALEELSPLKDKACLDSINCFNSHLYSDWQNAHNALSAPEGARWRPVDIFSRSWAVDSRGENIYGSHLLRRSFTLGAGECGPAVLHLGAMTDADSTFVNGVFVGNTTYMYPPRNYIVPEGVLHEGDNVVEIHLYACGGNPAGFVPDKEYSLETASGRLSFLDGWEHKAGRRMPARPGQVFLQYKPAGLYNAMLAPMRDYAFAGMIWYQGESNCSNASMYGELLETLIGSVREQSGSPGLPFYIIELAAFQHSELTDNDWGWNRVQKEQRNTAMRVDGAWLVPNADLGEWNDIHPQDKKTVGERTANVILQSRN